MLLVSVNVARPRLVMSNGQAVSTGIFKEPLEGRVMLRAHNLDGDRQADLRVHGGPDKAVYVYPSEHYEYWRRELPEMNLPWGMFGENFTTEGFRESAVNVGDRFRVGSAEVLVTTPRQPCYKLGIKFGRADIVERFLQSERSGFYLSVAVEGEVGAGDTFELISCEPHRVTIADLLRVSHRDRDDVETMSRALEVEALPGGWRERFRRLIEKRAESDGD
jgi:MOSC domain-containing protein YiiM